jgi:hypothetical protein
MTIQKVAATGTRIVIFAGSVFALLQATAVPLHSPTLRIVIGLVLLCIDAVVILAMFAWTLRKLWVISGVASIAFFAPSVRGTDLVSSHREDEVRA